MIKSKKIHSKNTKSLNYVLSNPKRNSSNGRILAGFCRNSLGKPISSIDDIGFQMIIMLNLVILLLIPIVSSENVNTTNTTDDNLSNVTNVTIIYQCPPKKGLSDSTALALQILLVYIGTVILLVVFETFFIINIVPRNMKISWTYRFLVIPFIYIMIYIFIKHHCYSNTVHSENDIEINNSSSSSKYQKNDGKENDGKENGGKQDDGKENGGKENGGKEDGQSLAKYYEKILTLLHNNKESSAA